MFRIQDNVPEVYINESRDFQILARLSDLLFSGIKYDVDSMVNILDSMLVKDRMLQLMCTKVGFFPTIEIDSQVLKYIISSFPYILKNKGNELGISYAVNAILKAENNPNVFGKPLIDIVNTIDGEEAYKEPYTVYIYTEATIYNKAALKEVLRYVLPAGYNYKLYLYNYNPEGGEFTLLNQLDKVTILKAQRNYLSQIRTPQTEATVQGGNLKKLVDTYIGAFDTTEISTPATEPIDNDNKISILYPPQS